MGEEYRGSARQRGYTPTWDKLSAVFKRSHPLCLGCEAVGRTTATQETDHIVPHKGDYELMWDQSNWQPACTWHHSVVKQQLEALFLHGAIGPKDLKLDSPKAIEMTMRLDCVIGDDGWPMP